MKAWILKYGFFVGLIGAIVLAFIFPEPGASGGLLHSELTTKIGVFIIFLIQGMLLPGERLVQDLSNWRLPLFVLAFNFMIIPLLAFLLSFCFRGWLSEDLGIGFFYLSVLPTTISTAVVYSRNAGGNQIAALFTVSISNILAVFAVPLWMCWWLQGSYEQALPVLPLLKKLGMLILLPLVVGQCLRPFVKGVADVGRQILSRVNITIILFILYVAFSNSVSNGMWAGKGNGKVIGVTVALSLLLLVLVKGLVWFSLKPFRFSRPDKITAFYCASQKSLASGVPMAMAIFDSIRTDAAEVNLGVVLLPILCYHALQLGVGYRFNGLKV